MQHKCQLSLFLFRGCQPAITEEYLFLLKKVPPQRFELEGLFHLRFQKSAWFGWRGPGPAWRSLWPWSQAGQGPTGPFSPLGDPPSPPQAPFTPLSPAAAAAPGRALTGRPLGSQRRHRKGGKLKHHLMAPPGGRAGSLQPPASFGRRRGRSRVSAPLNGTYQALRGWVRVCYAFCGQPAGLRVCGEKEKPRAV